MSQTTPSMSQKRPATARMRTDSPRKKSRTSSGILPTSAALDPTPATSGAWAVKANTGECPPYADHAGWVEDPFTSTLYTLGGTHPGDQNLLPTSDFFRCNTKTMKWENFTDKLQFRDPSDPFGLAELRRETRRLPRLSQPGLTLLRIHSTSFIFIFGGYSMDEGKPVSTLIAVDLNHLEWWVVPVNGGPIPARIKPVLVAIEHRIFIFGGDAKYCEVDPQSFRTYCILSYEPALHRWTWEAQDIPYPALIPPGQVFGAGLAVYNGKKIMLTPGKPLCHDEPLNFIEQKIFYFHTEHKQFQMAPHFGDFPKEVLWYSIHRFPSSSLHHPRPLPLPSRKISGSKREHGSSREAQSLSSPPSPSVILCAWVPRNSRYAIAELWRLSLSHSDEIRCLHKTQQIWDQNHDFQGCVVVNDQVILLGNKNPKIGEESWNIHLRVGLAPEDLEDKIHD